MPDAETAQAGLNIPLIDRVLEQIDGHPETWDQQVYANECGTAFCVAGWVAVLDGYTYAPRGVNIRAGWITPLGRSAMSSEIRCYAMCRLGLTDEQSWALFNGGNSRSAIETVLDAIREGAL